MKRLSQYGGSQAEAFRGNNDRILLDRVNPLSFQDTLRIQTSGFIGSSYIEGDVDFTWGTGAAFFWLDELKSMHAGWVSQVRNPPFPGSDSPPPNHGNIYLANRLTRAAGVPDARAASRSFLRDLWSGTALTGTRRTAACPWRVRMISSPACSRPG